MDYELKGDTPFPMAVVHLDANQQVQIENGSMIYYNDAIKLVGHLNSNGKKGIGGLMSAIGRGATSGESMFITTASATADGGEIAVAPGNPGVIQELAVDSEHQWRLNTGAFLASDESVSYQMIRQKASRALFGGTGGFFIMSTQGTGTMLISAYGELVPLDLDNVTNYSIDNDHVVAWSQGLDYDIEPASGLVGFKTGEGLVTRFSGSGRVYVQTRNLQALADLLHPYLPSGSSN